MADKRFYNCHGPFSIEEIAQISGGKVRNPSGKNTHFKDVAPLEIATQADVSFLSNPAYRNQLEKTKAGLCIIPPKFESYAPSGMILIIAENAYEAYARVAEAFYPAHQACLDTEPVISDKSHIEEGVQLGTDCHVETGAVIHSGAKLGDNVRIGANSVIGKNVEIGSRSIVGACASISYSLIGKNVHIYEGCRIGQDGFGFAMSKSGYVKVPQLGRVLIEDGVHIGANTAIDRGSGQDTVIGAGTWIDNLVQIGHNVKIGKGCVLVSQVGISGSTVIDDYVVIAGQAGIAGHLHIGKGARIGAQAGVMKDVPPGEEYMGSPAMPAKRFMRQVIELKRMVTK